MRFPRFFLLGATPLLALAACGGDATEPRAAATVSAHAGPVGSVQVDGQYRVSCPVTLRARAGASSLAWTGATLTWKNQRNGAVLKTATLTQAQTAELMGGAEIARGDSIAVQSAFWADEPFALEGRFAFRSGTRESGASVGLECKPPAAPLQGRYLLSTINDLVLPARSITAEIRADTLEFLPNLTYTLRGTVVGAQRVPFALGPMPYSVLSPDSLYLPMVALGTPGGTLVRSGTTLYFSEVGGPNGPIASWRFDLEGSNPQLPALPMLVVPVDTLFFEADSGGAVPPEQRFQVTSSTGQAIHVTFGTSIGTLGPGWHMGMGPPLTPAEIWVRPTRTAMPPGLYTITIQVTSRQAFNNPRIVEVVYRIRAP
jgi:hypothetical protein